jgi:flagellar hook-basal body complex protein FliE
MVGAIGGGGGELARAAIEAALKAQSEAARRVDVRVEAGAAPAAQPAPDFGDALAEGLRSVSGELRATERLPVDLVAGTAGDFHEVAARLKQSELTFKFALEVRNKLIDAYRETMRMSV